MAHHTTDHSYSRLSRRLSLLPQAAPPSDLLFQILKILFSEREAGLVAHLPVRPFSAKRAARIWKMPLTEAQNTLDALADKGLLVDIEKDGSMVYVLPPPMAGFFEFSMMRVRHDIDQHALAELFYEYINVQDEFIRALFAGGETQLGRILVHEPALPDDPTLHVLDYERASEVIKTATCRAISLCYCRHKMQHLGKACSAPLDICMTFNTSAKALVGHGLAREVSLEECLDQLQRAYDNDLVQFGENVRESMNFICNCCKCCCEAMIAARKVAFAHPVHTTNFLPVVDGSTCTACGVCVELCPVEAVSLQPCSESESWVGTVARVDESRCLGCGLCARRCPSEAIRLVPRAQRVITPLNSAHRVVLMAIERDKLQNLIVDRQVLWSHRALASVPGAILRLPPAKRLLAQRQVRSRFLEAALHKANV
ncbi:4Fe-4S binding protein [Candidatus Fermentibacteria bacterium]|nr:4Fe-4S binding protein [Candidatus Fermentibacteria bacterium]